MSDIDELLSSAPPLYARDSEPRRPLRLETVWSKIVYMAAEPWPKILRAPVKFGFSPNEEPLWYVLDVSDGLPSGILVAVKAYRGGREEPEVFSATLELAPSEDKLARTVVQLLRSAADHWGPGA